MSTSTRATTDLATTPVAELLVGLHRSRASGALHLERGRARKTLGLRDGQLVSAESSLPSESLCARLRDDGRIDGETAARASKLAADREIPEAAAVSSLGLLEPRALFEAIRARIEACAREAILWHDGVARFDPTDVPPEGVAAFRCDLAALVQGALRASWHSERIAQGLAARFRLYPAPRAGLAARVRSWLDDDETATGLLSLLDGDHTFEEVVGACFTKPALLAALWVGDRADLLRYAGQPRSTPGGPAAPEIEIQVAGAGAAVPTPSPSAARTEPGSSATSEEAEEVRKEIAELHRALDELDHYAILGVTADAAPAAIKKAYFQAAKRYHPDKLKRLGLDEVRDHASEVFAAIAEAHEVLCDAERRRSYDDALASGGATEDVDVTRIAQAEGFFRKGEVLVRMGDFRGAAELLETAVELWPEECVYQATLGWARFRKNPPETERAAEALREAVTLDPENARAHFWLSQVLRALGEVNGAAEHAARARRLDPDIA